MPETISAQAGWAIWSKQPGTREDYSVLSSSTEPLNPREFSRVLSHFAPGNPPSEPGTPASLPWATLSRVAVADEPYLGVSLQVRTPHVDAAGRPVSRTAYICVPYRSLTAVPVSYHGLFQAMNAAHVPPPDTAPVHLAIPPLDAREMARAVLNFGPASVAATAALLLSGPVTITGPGFPGWEDRLRFLDAVAALLPYGYRTSLTAATWSDSGASAHRLRLVFADRPGSSSSGIPWGAFREPTPRLAAEYYACLRRAADTGTEGLAALIGFLAAQTVPEKFEQPEPALAAIRQFLQPQVVSDKIKAGTGKPEEIRKLFREGRDQQLPAAEWRKALGQLIADANPEDWSFISVRLAEVPAHDADFLRPDITRACRRFLWSGESADLVRGYLRLLARHGLADKLLASLLTPDGPNPDNGLETASALLAEFVPGDPEAYPETRQALARSKAVGAALLWRLGSPPGNPKLEKTLKWLGSDSSELLDPFLAVFNAAASEAIVEPGAVLDLTDEGTTVSAARFLLRAASSRERLGLVLPGLAKCLVWEALKVGGHANSQYWRDVAMEVKPQTPEEAAWLDLCLLATANVPRAMFTGGFPASAYSRALATAWMSLINDWKNDPSLGSKTDDLLTGALASYLGQVAWRGNPAMSDVVTDLTKALTANGQRPTLSAVVHNVTETLRQLPPDTPSERIADACAQACAGGLPVPAICDALAQAGVMTSGARAAAVLSGVHHRVSPDFHQWQVEFAAAIVSGRWFGEEVAAGFTTRLVQESNTEVDYRLGMLNAAVRCREAGAPPALTDADQNRLENAQGFLKEILGTARKRSSGAGLWRTVGRRRSDRADEGGR